MRRTAVTYPAVGQLWVEGRDVLQLIPPCDQDAIDVFHLACFSKHTHSRHTCQDRAGAPTVKALIRDVLALHEDRKSFL